MRDGSCMILTYGDSQTGLVRKSNEDAIGLSVPGLYVLADGMGGYEGGQIASTLAVETVTAYWTQKAEDKATEDLLKEAILRANEAILARKKEEEGLCSMGTTLLVAALSGNQLFWAHVGDSRLYMWKEGVLSQITVDHSYVMELVEQGKLTKEAMRFHPRKNEITRAVGIDSLLKVDTGHLPAEEGSLFLLCSDGLTGMISDEDIHALVTASPRDSEEALEALGKALMEKVYEAGARDNVSFILVQI